MELFSDEETPLFETEDQKEQARLDQVLLLGQAAMELGY